MFRKITTGHLIVTFLALAAIGIFGRYLYKKPRLINGNHMPNIVLNLPNGKTAHLYDYGEKYILVDFWGSWCGPCLQQIPSLKNLYTSFKNAQFVDSQGFEIISIGIEKKLDTWKEAISFLQLPWVNSCDGLYFNSPLAKQLGVRVIPTNFLLNKDHIIIGVNKPIEEISKLLKEKRVQN